MTPLDLRLSTSKPAYAAGDPITLQLETTNNSDRPQTLAFPTSQEYDLVVTAAAGTAVWQASCNRVFLQAFHNRIVGPGETLVFTEHWDQRTCVPGSADQGEPVSTGLYTVVGRLTTFPTAVDSARVQLTIE